MSLRSRAFPAQSGASLLELMVVVVISGIAVAAIVKFLGQSTGAMTRVESSSELVYANQRISENLKASMDGVTDIVAAYGYAGGPDFSALHSAIAASISLSATAPKQVVFSRQSTVVNAGLIDLTGSSMVGDVGNELYFVSSLPPVSATVYLNSSGTAIVLPTPTTSTQGYVVNVDRLQFCALYLAYGHGALKNGKPPLRLVEWRSQPYAVLNNLTQSTGVYMTASCQAMQSLGYTMAIDDSQIENASSSFYTITSTGSSLVTSVPMPASFAESSWAYVDEFNLTQNYHRPTPGKDWGQVRGERTGAVVAAPSTFSFAYNNLTSSSSPVALASYSTQSRDNSNLLVPAYGTPDAGGGSMIGFPGGFEVMVVGEAGAREVLLRHVVMMGESDAVSRQRNQFLAMDGQDYFSCLTNN